MGFFLTLPSGKENEDNEMFYGNQEEFLSTSVITACSDAEQKSSHEVVNVSDDHTVDLPSSNASSDGDQKSCQEVINVSDNSNVECSVLSTRQKARTYKSRKSKVNSNEAVPNQETGQNTRKPRVASKRENLKRLAQGTDGEQKNDPDWNNKTVAIPKRSNRKRGSSNTIIEELLEPLRKKQRKPHMCRRCREELHIEVLLKNHRCPFKNGTHFLKGTDFGGTDDFNSMTEIDDRLLIDQPAYNLPNLRVVMEKL